MDGSEKSRDHSLLTAQIARAILNFQPTIPDEGFGGMAEWTKATVLKTVVGASSPGVRIPLPPS